MKLYNDYLDKFLKEAFEYKDYGSVVLDRFADLMDELSKPDFIDLNNILNSFADNYDEKIGIDTDGDILERFKTIMDNLESQDLEVLNKKLAAIERSYADIIPDDDIKGYITKIPSLSAS